MKSKILFFFLFSSYVMANNIAVNNIALTGQNTIDQYTLVQFDLSWENSWRISAGPSNYDGAWVFLKFRTNGGEWQHGTLNYVNGTAGADGHTEPLGSTINTTSDGVGAFIYRGFDGNGDVNFASINLRWNYGVDGIADESIVDVEVYAIEMVYIPQGDFQLGSSSNGTEVSHFYTNTGVAGEHTPYTVNSENSINVSSAVNDLYYDNSSFSGDQLGPIPAAFPKGFAAFWCMKYEITEDQWICFFNSLSQTQKLNHDITDVDHKNEDGVISGNTISWTSGNATTSAPSRAVGFLNYKDNAAYYDWCGLRFMTEFEFEKAAKGPLQKDNMVASGADVAYEEVYVVINDGLENENITNPGEDITNMNYGPTDIDRPMRVGIFASSATNPSRIETGGSYFGVMELSGNLYERLISAGTAMNRTYTGEHGDGELTVSGEHNVTGWPAISSTGAASYRGGSYINGISFCRIADRHDGGTTGNNAGGRIGARAGRSAE